MRSVLEDVDDDADTDLVLHFSIPAMKEAGTLTAETTEARLTGLSTMDRAFYWGVDSIAHPRLEIGMQNGSASGEGIGE